MRKNVVESGISACCDTKVNMKSSTDARMPTRLPQDVSISRTPIIFYRDSCLDHNQVASHRVQHRERGTAFLSASMPNMEHDKTCVNISTLSLFVVGIVGSLSGIWNAAQSYMRCI